MSSGEEDYNRSGTGEDPKPTKRGRTGRACDNCRRKKIRCDFTSNPEGKCSNCAAYNFSCTYVEAAKKRGPPKGYVESLENRLHRMETLLQRLCPDADFTQELGVHMDRETWWAQRNNKNESSAPTPTAVVSVKSRGSSKGRGNQKPTRGNSGGSAFSDDFVSDDDESVLPPLSEEVQRLTINSLDRRFHGKSSGWVLVQTAFDMKREYTGTDMERKQELQWNLEWDPKRPTDPASFEFPPTDLMNSLIPLYFFHNNLYLPLLHQPTFERQYNERLHERDPGFACVLLLVCAVASRFSYDSRVLRQDSHSGQGTPSLQTAGWKYFDQVQMQRKSLTAPASLFDLQQYALAGIFLQGSEAPYASWVTVGIGLRVAQDVGAHRRRNVPATVENELWKRAFWVLVNLDRLSSAALGRPCAIHDEDFDLDSPLEVNDEHWENSNSEEVFKQPANTPSYVSYFNALIKLDQMLSFTLRTIYSINKSKILLGYTDRGGWARDTVAELDTALNSWVGSVPHHLQWPLSEGPGSVYFQQSAILYATYYYIQILVHRPFIPRPGKLAPLTYPSLAICTNAARSCGQVLEEYLNNNCNVGSAPFLMFYAFTSGLVLLLNLWGMKKPGEAGEPVVQMQDVHRCMRFLKAAQDRWHLAGRLQTILYELASVGDFPLPQPSPGIGIKRSHDESESPQPVQEVMPSQQPQQRRPQIRRQRTRPISQPSINPQSQYHGLIGGPYDTDALANMPLHPNPLPPQGYISGMQMDDGSWFRESLAIPTEASSTSFGAQQATLSDIFNPANEQTYPSSAPPFTSNFEQQQPMNNNGYLDPNTMMQGQQNSPWEPTLNMWSMAPSGFGCDDWNTFIGSIPGPRPDDRPGPGPTS